MNIQIYHCDTLFWFNSQKLTGEGYQGEYQLNFRT